MPPGQRILISRWRAIEWHLQDVRIWIAKPVSLTLGSRSWIQLLGGIRKAELFKEKVTTNQKAQESRSAGSTALNSYHRWHAKSHRYVDFSVSRCVIGGNDFFVSLWQSNWFLRAEEERIMGTNNYAHPNVLVTTDWALNAFTTGTFGSSRSTSTQSNTTSTWLLPTAASASERRTRGSCSSISWGIPTSEITTVRGRSGGI